MREVPHPLFSQRVAEALAGIDGRGGDPLARASALRRSLPPDLARTAAELLELRGRARGKLLDAERLLLTRKGLEQATDHRVAAVRAAQVARLGPDTRVWDATAGLGADARALAEAGLALVAVEREPLTASVLAHNLALLSPDHPTPWVLRADAGALPRAPSPPGRDVLILDPDRRPTQGPGAGTGGPREGNPEAWSPPLSTCLALAEGFAGACIKLPPGFDASELPDPGTCLQWVSLRGELRELGLWTGDLAAGQPGRRAVVLDRAGRASVLEGETPEADPLSAEEATRVAWIAEPDPAVIRGGFVGRVARDLGGRPLGPALAYLGGNGAPPESPFVHTWNVLAEAALDPKRVRAMLRAHDVGRLTVKKRGHPEPAESLAKRLRGPGARRGVVLVARLERGHRAYLVEPLHRPA